MATVTIERENLQEEYEPYDSERLGRALELTADVAGVQAIKFAGMAEAYTEASRIAQESGDLEISNKFLATADALRKLSGAWDKLNGLHPS